MLTFILAALILAFLCVISWALTCGVLYLVCLCFTMAFSLKIATGVWLILFLLSQFFGKSNNSKK